MNGENRKLSRTIGVARYFAFTQHTRHLSHTPGNCFRSQHGSVGLSHSARDIPHDRLTKLFVRQLLDLSPNSRSQVGVAYANLPPT